jgi:hypothetical protein
MTKNAQIIYPIYLELSKRFHLGIPPCREFEMSPAREDADALVQVERWLRRADTQIEVHHIRELVGQVIVAGDDLHALLAWHLGKEPKDKSDRDKINFFLVRYLAECLPVNMPAHQLSFEQVAEVLRPVLGEAITPKRLPSLEDCIRDLDKCVTLGDFVDHWILERGRALKVTAQEKPFDSTTLVAFTHFSFLLRLSSIRVLHEDIRALEEDLRELENKGVTEIDVASMSAGSSEKQWIGELRRLCEKWKQYFPGKYTQNQWFTDVIRLRSSVKRALQKSISEPESESTEASATKVSQQGKAAAPDSSQSTHPAAMQEIQLQAEVERYLHEIANQVQSPIGGRASSVIAVDLAGLRLMLSTGEVDAFQEPCEGMNLILQHAVAVRAVLLAALNNAIDLRAAINLTESEALVLQEQITVTKETGNTEAAVNLTACYRSLRKVLEKMDKALLSGSGESLRIPQAQRPKQQPTEVKHS